MTGDIKSRIRQRLNLKNNRIFCVGAGGVGVSALAELLVQAGCQIYGSDMTCNSYCRHLESLGVKIAPAGHRAENVPPLKFDALIATGAVNFSNPEIALLLARDGVTPLWRGEALGELICCFERGVAVAGSHGKSSVTAMLSWILHKHNIDSGVLIGASYADDSPRVLMGNGDILVTEADENDRGLTMLQGELALITNIDGDHAWTAEALEEQERDFRTLSRQFRHTICIDSPNTRRVLEAYPGIDYLGGARLAELDAMVPERFVDYERSNAALAIAGAEYLGVPAALAAQYIESYPGIKRRQCLLYSSEQIMLWEDYAHHPAELAGSLRVLAKRAGSRRQVVVFEPHRYERLSKYFDEFVNILSDPELDVRVMDLFAAWKMAGVDAVSSNDLAAAVNRKGGHAQLLSGRNYPVMADQLLAELLADGCARQVALIGAGNVHTLAAEMTDLLKNNA